MHDIIKHYKHFLLSFYLIRDRITRQRNECFTAFKWVPDGLCLVQPDGAGHLKWRDSGRKRERILQTYRVGIIRDLGKPVPDLRMRCRAFRHSDERGALDCGKLVVITRSEEVQC